MPVLILGAFLAILTAAGVSWYSLEIHNQIQKEEKPLEIGTVEEPPKKGDLIDLGTGPMAEEAMGNKIRKAQSIIFVSGAMNRTIFNLLRKHVPRYPPPNIPLQLLINKNFGRIFIRELGTRFQCEIKETRELSGPGGEGTAPTITLINIDGRTALIFNEENHQVFESRTQEAATRLSALNRRRWNEAQRFIED